MATGLLRRLGRCCNAGVQPDMQVCDRDAGTTPADDLPTSTSPGGRLLRRGLPDVRQRRARAGEHDYWNLVGQLPDGPLFLMLAPRSLTLGQVLEIAEQVTYTR